MITSVPKVDAPTCLMQEDTEASDCPGRPGVPGSRGKRRCPQFCPEGPPQGTKLATDTELRLQRQPGKGKASRRGQRPPWHLPFRVPGPAGQERGRGGTVPPRLTESWSEARDRRSPIQRGALRLR